MCGRFFLEPDDMSDAELIALLDREKAKAGLEEQPIRIKKGEIRPGDCAAVIAMNRRLQRSAFAMQWGFRMDKRLIFNARSETAADKPLFRQSLEVRRCLIPASSYFEWDHRQQPHQKYGFRLENKEQFYLAGLYRFEDPAALPVFTILTREAAPEIACFHDRMPVIIPEALKDAWLDRQNSPAELIRQAQTKLEWYPAT